MTTVNSAFWGGGYAQYNTNSTARRREAQLLGKRMNQKDRELMRTLLGAVAGSTATKTFKRIAANTAENGGKRVIETRTLVSRATTAADVTDLKAKILAFVSQPTTYAKDKAQLGMGTSY